MDVTDKIISLISCGIDWQGIEDFFGASLFSPMKSTPQNPVYHGEGDVFTHTKMVCECLAESPGFQALTRELKAQLFPAALFHDIGKPGTTAVENGEIRSPGHQALGSRMTRDILWDRLGLCGSPELASFRETVCMLVRFHMLPFFLPEKEDPLKAARTVASIGELAGGFSLKLLAMLACADALGRITSDAERHSSAVALSEEIAAEAGCLSFPFAFPDSFTKHAYLSGRNVPPDVSLYDSTWGEVIMMSGLPGTGKSTYVKNYFSNLPEISLDGIRKELRIKPSEPQGLVINTAKERAKAFLRRKEPFVWNATDLTPDVRKKLTGLFERYGARVRIVYLETSEETRAARNAGRAEAVPEKAVLEMKKKTVPPFPSEAQTVEWIFV